MDKVVGGKPTIIMNCRCDVFSKLRERIIVPLDRQFVVYLGNAGVDEGASVDEGDIFYTGSLLYNGTLFCRDAGIHWHPLLQGCRYSLHRQPV